MTSHYHNGPVPSDDFSELACHFGSVNRTCHHFFQSEYGSATVPVALFGVSPNIWYGRCHSPFGAPGRVRKARRRDADESGRDDLPAPQNEVARQAGRAPQLQLHRSGLAVA